VVKLKYCGRRVGVRSGLMIIVLEVEINFVL